MKSNLAESPMTISASDINTQFPSPQFSIGMRPRISIPLINIACSSFTWRRISAIFSDFYCSATSFLGFTFTFRFLTYSLLIILDLVCFDFMNNYFKLRMLGCPKVISRNMKKIALITKPLILMTFYFTSTSVVS